MQIICPISSEGPIEEIIIIIVIIRRINTTVEIKIIFVQGMAFLNEGELVLEFGFNGESLIL